MKPVKSAGRETGNHSHWRFDLIHKSSRQLLHFYLTLLVEPVASVDAETFDNRYERALQVARREFGEDTGKRQQFQREARRGASIDREYVVDELGEIASSVENTDQQQTLAQFQDIVETVSADPILDEFRNLRNEKVTGEELVAAVREIMFRYNLQEKYEERQQWAEEQDEPPHVVAGMCLRGEG